MALAIGSKVVITETPFQYPSTLIGCISRIVQYDPNKIDCRYAVKIHNYPRLIWLDEEDMELAGE